MNKLALLFAILFPLIDCGASSAETSDSLIVPGDVIYWRSLPARDVRFPPDSIGKYGLNKAGKTGVGSGFSIELIKSGAAAGLVHKPANLVLSLRPSYTASKQLQALDSLKPDDLDRLDLKQTDVKDNDLEHVGRLTGLSELSLNETEIGDAGLKFLSRLKHLHVLEVRNTNVGNNGIEALVGLPQLTQLTIAADHVDNNGAAYLTRIKSLHGLNLSLTQIKDSGVASVIANLNELESLKLNDMWLTDKAIEGISGLRQLVVLSISNSRITDASVPQLARLPNLQQLNLTGSKITRKGMNALIKALPKCEIRFGTRQVKMLRQ